MQKGLLILLVITIMGFTGCVIQKNTQQSNNPLPTANLNQNTNKPDNTSSALCTSKPTESEIGSLVYPNDPKYSGLDHLGPFFTAYNCGSSRLNQLLRNTTGNYSLGSTVWLKNNPSQALKDTLKSIGYICDENVSENSCKKWQLKDTVNVSDLFKLEPFYMQLQSDDCVHCG